MAFTAQGTSSATFHRQEDAIIASESRDTALWAEYGVAIKQTQAALKALPKSIDLDVIIEHAAGELAERDDYDWVLDTLTEWCA